MRLDVYLVSSGQFESRARAQGAIKAGLVTVNGRACKKPSEKVSDSDVVSAMQEHPWVSRGGMKLAHALTVFDVNQSGRVVVDIGSSTGGFTDVLLSKGANRVYAVDVGTNQLHAKLQGHERIVLLEQTDARELTTTHIPEPFDLLVCDASFISVMKVLGPVMNLAPIGCELICLIKPQFEVGRQGLGRGGVVKDVSLTEDVKLMVKNWVSAEGWQVQGVCNSPIKGGDGNREYLLHAVK